MKEREKKGWKSVVLGGEKEKEMVMVLFIERFSVRYSFHSELYNGIVCSLLSEVKLDFFSFDSQHVVFLGRYNLILYLHPFYYFIYSK